MISAKVIARRTLDRLPAGVLRQLLYIRAHGRPARLRRPRFYSEKVNWRILRDRRPLIGAMGDKLRMKEYAASAGAPVLVPETLWAGESLAELAKADLAENWVLKPNHRSGLVHFGQGRPDADALGEITRGWLDENPAVTTQREWIYTQARRLLLAEPLLGTPGRPPIDYKFYVFDGVPRLVETHTARFRDLQFRWYTPEWKPLEEEAFGWELGPVLERPPNYGEMLTAAGILGREFDFIRVDLYNIDGHVYFGELTPYPASGLDRFCSPNFDRELGDHWILPALAAARSAQKALP